MLFQLGSKLFRMGSVWILVISTLTTAGYLVLKPTKPQLTIAQQNAINEFKDGVRSWVSELAPIRQPVIFLTLGRDQFGEISTPLRHSLWQSDRFDLEDESAWERALRLIEWKLPTTESRSAAIEHARSRGAGYVVWGYVDEFSDIGDVCTLNVKMEVVEAQAGNVIAARAFDLSTSHNLGFHSLPRVSSGSEWTYMTRTIVWILFTLLLPLISYPISRRIVIGDSNPAILALLIAHVLASVFFAYFILLSLEDGWLNGLALLVVLAFAFVYNLRALLAIKDFNG